MISHVKNMGVASRIFQIFDRFPWFQFSAGRVAGDQVVTMETWRISP